MPPRPTRLVHTPGICLLGSRGWSAPREYASSAQVFVPTQRNWRSVEGVSSVLGTAKSPHQIAVGFSSAG
eukprot:1183994-Prorocentrum_minimum.AAC.6